jgi:hypothetical protein
MRKLLLLAFITLLLCVPLINSLSTDKQPVKAQTVGPRGFPIVYPTNIISPTNTTYNSKSLTLNITAQILFKPGQVNITMMYCVDGRNVSTVSVAEVPENERLTTIYPNGTTEENPIPKQFISV